MIVENIRYASPREPEPLSIPGVLTLPGDGPAPRPAVLIVHGSSGPDSRGPSYARELRDAGFVTLEIDMWAARGLRGGLDRPKTLHETLPDIFDAFRYLASRRQVDASRIGILGFSWGGVLSMLSATRAVSERFLGHGARFAAHAPLYPVCWLYNRAPGFEFRELTGAPVFLQCGEADTYDEPDTGARLARSVAEFAPGVLSVETYKGATHAFDRSEPEIVVNDPFAHLGKGGEVRFAYNAEAAALARANTRDFFVRVLGP